MVYLNFTLQCQHFDIFLSLTNEILCLEVGFLLVTGVDINVKT